MAEVSVAADMLQSFVRRIESLDDEILAMNADKSEVYKEAKGNGFDVKVLRKLIADRRKDASERAEFETIYELYAEALGMRLYRDEGDRPTLVRAHVENTDEFPVEHDEDGVFPDDEQDAIRPETVTLLSTVTSAMQTEAGRAALITALDVMIEREEINEQQPAPAARDLTESRALTGQVANHTLETADAVETERAPVEPCNDAHGEGNGLPLKGDETANVDSAAGKPSVGERFGGALAADAFTQREDDASPAPSLTNITQLRAPKPLRPNCLKPSMCGASGPVHCWSCVKALGERKEAAQ